jgi:HEAT repeat protein
MQRFILLTIVLLSLALTARSQDQQAQLDKLLAQAKQDKNPDLRTGAITKIAKLKPEVAVPALVGILATPEEEVRLHAAMALGELGKPAVAALEKALGDPDETVRFYAVWALGLVGAEAKSATPALIAALRDEDEEVRYKAAFALGRVAPESDEAITALVGALKDTDTDVLAEVVMALSKLGVRAVPPLRKALGQPQIAYYAADALGKLAHSEDDATVKAAILAVPDVLRAFQSKRLSDEQMQMTLLPAFGTKALPVFRGMLNDKDAHIRFRIAPVLGQIGVEAEAQADAAACRQVVEMLITLLADDDAGVRVMACNNLGMMTLHPDLTEPAINKACLDVCYTVGLAAYVGQANRSANPQEVENQLDKRIAAAKGDDSLRLACLLPVRHARLLLKNLEHTDAALRLRCACALAVDLASTPQPAATLKQIVPILAEALKSAQATQRRDAAEALLRLAPHADAGVTAALLASLKNADEPVRGLAVVALAQVPNRDAKATVSALVPLLESTDPGLRQNVVLALRPCGAAAVPHLAGMLKDSDLYLRMQVCQALQEMMNAATEAVPALLALAKTTDGWSLAIPALHKIVPDRAFALLLETLEADKAVGPTLHRAGKAGKEPAKLIAALMHDMKDDDLRTARDAAEALDRLETIMPESQTKVLLHPDVMDMLHPIPKLALKRLGAADADKRRDVVGQLAALRSIVQAMQNRFGRAEIKQASDTLPMVLSTTYQAIEDTLQLARNDRDRDVRRLARRALRENLGYNPTMGLPLGFGPVPFGRFSPPIP